jgi:hypothetical protein
MSTRCFIIHAGVVVLPEKSLGKRKRSASDESQVKSFLTRGCVSQSFYFVVTACAEANLLLLNVFQYFSSQIDGRGKKRKANMRENPGWFCNNRVDPAVRVPSTYLSISLNKVKGRLLSTDYNQRIPVYSSGSEFIISQRISHHPRRALPKISRPRCHIQNGPFI